MFAFRRGRAKQSRESSNETWFPVPGRRFSLAPTRSTRLAGSTNAWRTLKLGNLHSSRSAGAARRRLSSRSSHIRSIAKTAARHLLEELHEHLEYMDAKHRPLFEANGVVFGQDAVLKDFVGHKRITALFRARGCSSPASTSRPHAGTSAAQPGSGPGRDLVRAAALLAASKRAEAAITRLRGIRAAGDSRLAWLEPFRNG